jgi:hypothetical protein
MNIQNTSAALFRQLLYQRANKAYEIIRKVKDADIIQSLEQSSGVNEGGNKTMDDYDDHLYLVQIDSVIPLPYFEIDLSKEIDRLRSIGTIMNEVPILDINEEDLELMKQYQQEETMSLKH